MNREELAPILLEAYQRAWNLPPAQWWLAAADAAIEAMKPEPADDDRRAYWRSVYVNEILSMSGRTHASAWVLGIADTLAQRAVAAEAEKRGKP